MGALVAMPIGTVTSGGLLLTTDIVWMPGPLAGCAASGVAYVVVSLATFPVQPRGDGAVDPGCCRASELTRAVGDIPVVGPVTAVSVPPAGQAGGRGYVRATQGHDGIDAASGSAPLFRLQVPFGHLTGTIPLDVQIVIVAPMESEQCRLGSPAEHDVDLRGLVGDDDPVEIGSLQFDP